MDEMDHKLILDCQGRHVQARCSCGGWKKAPVAIRVQKLRDVYDLIEEEHGRHVEEAESREPSLA